MADSRAIREAALIVAVLAPLLQVVAAPVIVQVTAVPASLARTVNCLDAVPPGATVT